MMRTVLRSIGITFIVLSLLALVGAVGVAMFEFVRGFVCIVRVGGWDRLTITLVVEMIALLVLALGLTLRWLGVRTK